MGYPILAHKNRADAATLSGGSWVNTSTIFLDNLKNANIDKVARTTDATLSSTRVLVDLGAMYILRVIALAKHNLSSGGRWRARLGTSPMDIEFLTQGAIDSRVTAAGGANGTRWDSTGKMVAASAPRIDHDPFDPENGALYTEDMTQRTAWSTLSGATVMDAQAVSMPVGGIARQPTPALLPNTTYTVSAEVQLVSGNGEFAFDIFDGVSTAESGTKVATERWKRISFAATTSASASVGSGTFYAKKLTDSGVIRFRKWIFTRGSTVVGYRKNTSTAYFRSKGLKVEIASTNQVTNSDDLSTAAFSNASPTANVSAGPDGTNTLDRLTTSAASGVAYKSFAAAGNTKQCFSIFFRAVDNVNVTLKITWYNGGATQTSSMTFNPSTLAADATPTLSGAGAGLCGVEPVAKGLYRAFVSGTGTDAANATVQIAVIVATSGTSVDLGGWQAEQTLRPTSYIPTTSAAVTRSAEQVSIGGADFTNVYNSVEGTMLAEFYVGNGIVDTSVHELHTVMMTDSGLTNGIRCRLVTGTGATGTADFFTQSPSWDSTGAAVAAGTVARIAGRYRQSDWASAVNGGAVETKIQALIPTPDRFQLSAGLTGSSYLRRFTYWPRGLSNDQIQAISATGADAAGYSTAWLNTMQMVFQNDAPSTWGAQYNLLAAFGGVLARYLTLEFDDTSNSAGYLEFGRLFAGGGFQPARGASWGMKDSRDDLSTLVRADGGKEFGMARRRRRQVDFQLQWLTQDEADLVHELQDDIGILGDVVYVPDPDDLARSQRYGGIGTLSELSPIDYPHVLTRAVPFRWKEKL